MGTLSIKIGAEVRVRVGYSRAMLGVKVGIPQGGGEC